MSGHHRPPPASSISLIDAAAAKPKGGELVLIGGRPIGTTDFEGSGLRPAVRAGLARRGVRVVTRFVAVKPPMSGFIQSMEMPPGLYFDAADRMRVLPRRSLSPLLVVVGRSARPHERIAREGRSIYDTFPELRSAVTKTDSRATASRLSRLGFRVEWILLDADGSRPVPGPLADTCIVSVLSRTGAAYGVPRRPRALQIELADSDTASALGHACTRTS